LKALFIGRFQPLHKGHLKAVEEMLREVDEVIMVIGSSQYGGTVENPFTAEEREEMLSRALAEEGIKKCSIYRVPDIDNDSLYPAHVASLVPSFDLVYSGNPLVQRLFREAGWEVRRIELIRGDVYSGTEIRRRMKKGERWEHLVPKAVAEYLKEINGVGRVRELERNG